MILFEDLGILLDPPIYAAGSNYGIKQIDINESIFQTDSSVLFLNAELQNPVLKVYNMQGVQVGNNYTANEIKNGVYVFSISYLILKTLHGMTAGNYLIVVSIGQEGDSRIVEVTQAAPAGTTANGGFR